MDKIIIDYEPFQRSSSAWVYHENKDGSRTSHRVSFDNNINLLTDQLIALSYSEQAFHVQVSASPIVVDEINQQVLEKENKKYSANKILIEGIV